MSEDSRNTGQTESRWFIDLDWFLRSGRSFLTVARDCLCPKCRERLMGDEGEVLDTELLATIRDCCSQAPGFITHKSPILESAFRVFLANGNQPLGLEELHGQLAERWEGDAYRVAPEVLSRLLSNDQYYGLSQVET